MIALTDTTNAAAATNTVKLLKAICRYPTVVISCPTASAPRLPTASRAITETRNSVVFFLSMLREPTINPKINRISRVADVPIAVTKAARIAITNPAINAHFPIKSNSILHLFLVVN